MTKFLIPNAYSALPKHLRSFHGLVVEYRSRFGSFPDLMNIVDEDIGFAITSDTDCCIVETLWIHLDKFQQSKTSIDELRRAVVLVVHTFKRSEDTGLSFSVSNVIPFAVVQNHEDLVTLTDEQKRGLALVIYDETSTNKKSRFYWWVKDRWVIETNGFLKITADTPVPKEITKEKLVHDRVFTKTLHEKLSTALPGAKLLQDYCPRSRKNTLHALIPMSNREKISDVLKHQFRCPKLRMLTMEFHSFMTANGVPLCIPCSELYAEQCKEDTRCLMTPEMAKSYSELSKHSCETIQNRETIMTQMYPPIDPVDIYSKMLHPVQLIEAGQFDIGAILESTICAKNSRGFPQVGIGGLLVDQILRTAVAFTAQAPVISEVAELLYNKRYRDAYVKFLGSYPTRLVGNPFGEFKQSFLHHWVFIVIALHVALHGTLSKSLILELIAMAHTCGVITTAVARRLYVLADTHDFLEPAASPSTCRTIADCILENDSHAFVTADIGMLKTSIYRVMDDSVRFRGMAEMMAKEPLVVCFVLKHLITNNITDRLPAQILTGTTLHFFREAILFLTATVRSEVEKCVAENNFSNIPELIARQSEEYLRPPLKSPFFSTCYCRLADVVAFVAIIYYSLRSKKPFTEWIKPLAKLGSDTGILTKSEASDLVRRVHFEYPEEVVSGPAPREWNTRLSEGSARVASNSVFGAHGQYRYDRGVDAFVPNGAIPTPFPLAEHCSYLANFSERAETVAQRRLLDFNRVMGVMGNTFELNKDHTISEYRSSMIRPYRERFIRECNALPNDAFVDMFTKMIASKSFGVAPTALAYRLVCATYDFLLVSGFMAQLNTAIGVLIASRSDENPDCADVLAFQSIKDTVWETHNAFFNRTAHFPTGKEVAPSSAEEEARIRFFSILLTYRNIGRWAHCETDDLLALIAFAASFNFISIDEMNSLSEKCLAAKKVAVTAEVEKPTRVDLLAFQAAVDQAVIGYLTENPDSKQGDVVKEMVVQFGIGRSTVSSRIKQLREAGKLEFWKKAPVSRNGNAEPGSKSA